MDIDDTQRLLVGAVCLAPGPARDAWRRWRALVDFDSYEQPADRLDVLPALARRPEVLDGDPAGGRVRGMYRRTWASNQLLWQLSAPALDALHAAGIRFALLDAAALHDLLDDLGARPADALDVLVGPADVRRALDTLTAVGWTATAPTDERSLRGAGPVALSATDGGRLRLHRRLLATSVGDRADDAVWAAALPRDGGRPGYRLHPADLLLRLLAGAAAGAGAGADRPGGRVVDAHRLIAAGPPELGRRLAAQARAHHVHDACIEQVRQLAAVAGTPACWQLLRTVQRVGPAPVERLARRGGGTGRAGRAMAALGAHAAGGTGLRRGVWSLLTARLDLSLTAHPAFAVTHAALGRPRALVRLVRGSGRWVRVYAADPAPLHVGGTLDLTDPVVLDAYGGPGWREATRTGAASTGREAWLVLPLLAVPDRPVTLVLDLAADHPVPARVAVDGRVVASTPGGGGPARVVLPLPATAGPQVEVALRSSRRRLLWPRPLFVVVRSVSLVAGEL